MGFLFDHLISKREHRRWHGDGERLGGSEIEDQVELGWLQDRQIGGLFALKDLADVAAGLAIRIRKVGSIARQSAGCGVLAQIVDRGNCMARFQRGKLIALG